MRFLDRPDHQMIRTLLEAPSDHWVKNSRVLLEAVHVGDKILPVTVCEGALQDSYVCSPYTHYIRYATEELSKTESLFLKKFGTGFLRLFGKFLNPKQIDKNVIVNNWLLPTNLYPTLSVDEIQTLTEALIKKYPDHAILFRSVNPHHPKGLFENLRQMNYEFLIGRGVYLTDLEKDKPFQSRMFKSDQKLLRETPYRIIEDRDRLLSELPRIRELYEALNVEKYSKYNPQYTENFIREALQSGWMQFKAFEYQGKIDAVLGFFVNENTLTSPFFGYDTRLPEELGLYRLLATQLLMEAQKNGLLLHHSGGAGHYKKLRRARGYPEYTAFFTHHLDERRKLRWKSLKGLMNTFEKKFIDLKD